MTSRFILTASEMRAAEARAIAAGTPVEALMERAGLAAAEAIWRHAGPMPALVLCGPGNNGGDGYVIARSLRERGAHVRAAALGPPQSAAARAARDAWGTGIETFGEGPGAPLLVDALFGTGLARPLESGVCEALLRLAAQASVKAAIDLPSGVSGDDGALLSPVPGFDLTITFQTLKPAHLLQPAAAGMGRIVVADIGVEAHSHLTRLERPQLPAPGPQDHKYSRGYAALLAGEMPGAIALAAAAAARGGAGYARIIADREVAGVPSAVVQSRGAAEAALSDPRIGAIVAGPGLGRDGEAARRLDAALAAAAPLVLDADALFLLAGGLERLHPLHHVPILTPHGGEFERLFGGGSASKVERARRAAQAASAVLVFKGASTVVASPDGRAAIAAPAPAWLASAGTGDVLCGVIAAMRARGLEAFEAACAGVWLHGKAAELAGPALVADDLLPHLAAAQEQCL